MLPRRFALIRHVDYTGVAGTGVIAYGVAFDDGQVVLRWSSAHHATSLLDSVEDLIAAHGHGEAASIEWIDAPPGQADGALAQPGGRRARRPATPPDAQAASTSEIAGAPPTESADVRLITPSPSAEAVQAPLSQGDAQPGVAASALPATPALPATAARPATPAPPATAAPPATPALPATAARPATPALPPPGQVPSVVPSSAQQSTNGAAHLPVSGSEPAPPTPEPAATTTAKASRARTFADVADLRRSAQDRDAEIIRHPTAARMTEQERPPTRPEAVATQPMSELSSRARRAERTSDSPRSIFDEVEEARRPDLRLASSKADDDREQFRGFFATDYEHLETVTGLLDLPASLAKRGRENRPADADEDAVLSRRNGRHRHGE